MKHLTLKAAFLTFIAIIYSIGLWAQTPQKMSYQAVIRDASGYLITSTAVGMRVSIIPDTISASPVYVETQTPTTNANGLATIAIGTGTVVSGSFSTINWGTGVYFIKTEIDPTGGSSYSITSSQQLMSVPYALYAQTSGSSGSGGGGGSGGTHYIGESYGGGIVFYVYQSSGVQHGLIVSLVDVGDSVQWSNITSTAVGTTAQSRWDGLSNSLAIVAQSGHTTSAAKLCLDYTYTDSTGTYDDWYLPAVDEWLALLGNAFVVDKALSLSAGFDAHYMQYWISTETWSSDADFINDGIYTASKVGHMNVRAVRRF